MDFFEIRNADEYFASEMDVEELPIKQEVFTSEIDAESPIKQEIFTSDNNIDGQWPISPEVEPQEIFNPVNHVEDLLIKQEIVTSEFDGVEKPITQSREDPLLGQSKCAVPSEDRKLRECKVLLKKLFECSSCGFHTANKTDLTTHMQSHPQWCLDKTEARFASKEIFNDLICDDCGLRYSSSEVLACHMDFCHSSNPIVKVLKLTKKRFSFECQLCKTVSKRHEQIINHVHQKHKMGTLPFRCNFCRKQFTQKSKLRSHLKVCRVKISVTTHNLSYLNVQKEEKSTETKPALSAKKSFNCIHCTQVFNGFVFFKTHCNDKHPGKNMFKCEHCTAEFSTLDGYVKHRKYIHSRSAITCKFCSSKFTYPESLRRHIITHHTVLEKSFPCKLCSATFKFAGYLYRHVSQVHAFPVIYCAHCSYKTKRKDYLISHIRRAHFKWRTGTKYIETEN